MSIGTTFFLRIKKGAKFKGSIKSQSITTNSHGKRGIHKH
jgi:hypothetical protein